MSVVVEELKVVLDPPIVRKGKFPLTVGNRRTKGEVGSRELVLRHGMTQEDLVRTSGVGGPTPRPETGSTQTIP